MATKRKNKIATEWKPIVEAHPIPEEKPPPPQAAREIESNERRQIRRGNK